MIFSIIDTEGGGLLVQKDSVSKFFGNWGKLRDDIAFQRDELLTDELEHWVAFESIEYKHLCGLNLREHFEGIYGNIIIDGIYIHYYISAEAGTIGILKARLESEGTYSILTEMASGPEVGFDVEVKYFDNDIVAWTSITTNIGVPIPSNSLEGYLFNKADSQDFEETISLALTKKEPEEKKEMREKYWKIRDKAREVLIPLPIFFSKKQLIELVKDVPGRYRM